MWQARRKYILIIPKQNRSNSQTKPLYDTDKQMKHRSLQKRDVDEKTVLIDTVDVCYSDIFLKKVADALDGRSLDYLVVNHMEPDHAGSIRLLRQQYPDVQIVGNNKTFGMLEGYHQGRLV